jgi:hypothetical protein
MFKFSEYITEQKNTHMTHIEDAIIYGGVDGARQAIMALRSLRDMLAGQHAGRVSVKWDGAPAVFCGIDPTDGKFFVAKKGIFNKDPKVYKTPSDIDADTSGDLNRKLKLALQYLPELGITGVIQGDFLFDVSDLKTETIKGEQYLTFHPNTIVYAVPVNSEAAKMIKRSKIGIVWHTTYTGNTFESMKASYGVDVSKLRKSANVWSQDAMLRDMTQATMSKEDTDEVNKLLSQAGTIFNKISGSTLRQLEKNQDLAAHIETFANSFVRQGVVITDTTKHVDNLIKWIHDKYEKEAEKKKTPAGKATQYQKRDALLEFFSVENKASLKSIFDLQKYVVLAKLKLINILNRINKIGTFVKTAQGFKVTGHEGFVAIDQLGDDALKIVDRLEFSYNNFSPDTLKGWDKPGR